MESGESGVKLIVVLMERDPSKDFAITRNPNMEGMAAQE